MVFFFYNDRVNRMGSLLDASLFSVAFGEKGPFDHASYSHSSPYCQKLKELDFYGTPFISAQGGVTASSSSVLAVAILWGLLAGFCFF